MRSREQTASHFPLGRGGHTLLIVTCVTATRGRGSAVRTTSPYKQLGPAVQFCSFSESRALLPSVEFLTLEGQQTRTQPGPWPVFV